MKIPFHRPFINNDDIDSVCESIRSGWITMGSKTFEFEKLFRNYLHSKYAVSVNSATAALHLALNAIGVEKNDEVIIPTSTFVATAETIVYSGGIPVLCDIESYNHNINVELIEEKITSRTKAIVPVHFGGHPCQMDEISIIAKKNKLKIIEDAAHALPSKYKNKQIGTIGDVTCFSFYATKTMTTGEGGMLVTDDKELADKAALQRLHGINKDSWARSKVEKDWYYEVVELGYKYNTTDFQSALGISQLKKLESMREKRKRIAEIYINAFSDKIDFISELDYNKSSWHLFVIKVLNRDELYKKLKAKGIDTAVHFIPIHKHPYYRERFSYSDKDYPIANTVYEQCLSLPIYPGLNNDEINYIIQYVLQYAESVN